MKDRDFHLEKMHSMTGPASLMAAGARALRDNSHTRHPAGPLLMDGTALRYMEETRAILDELQARAGEWEWPAP